MNWGRVKTVLIILFLCTDIFLLAIYLTSEYSSSTIPSDVIASTVQVLKNNGIQVDPSVIPQKIQSAPHFEAVNVINSREEFAKKLLGNQITPTEFGFAGAFGTVNFYGDRFNYTMNPGADGLLDINPITNEKSAKSAAVSVLENLGLDLSDAKITVTKDMDGFTITADNTAHNLPIFNSSVSVKATKTITSVSGIWFNSYDSSGLNNLKNITSVLIDFIPNATQDIKITKLELGYHIFDFSQYHKSATLIPVWKVTFEDSSVTYLDARNFN